MKKTKKKNNTSGKVIAGTLAVALGIGGGIAGGVAIANNDINTRLEQEKKKGYDEGYGEGVKVNVGVSEDEVQEREENARQEGYDEGYEQGLLDQKTHGTSGKRFSLEDFGDIGDIEIEQIDDDYTFFIVQNGEKPGTYLLDRNSQTYEQLSEDCNGIIAKTRDSIFCNFEQNGVKATVGKFDKSTRELKNIEVVDSVSGFGTFSVNATVLKKGILLHASYSLLDSADVIYEDIAYLSFDSEIPEKIVEEKPASILDVQKWENLYNGMFYTTGKKEEDVFKIFDEETKTFKKMESDLSLNVEYRDNIISSIRTSSRFKNDNKIVIQIPQNEFGGDEELFLFDKENLKIKKLHCEEPDKDNEIINWEIKEVNNILFFRAYENQTKFYKLGEDGLLSLVVKEGGGREGYQELFKIDASHIALSSQTELLILDNQCSEVKKITAELEEACFYDCTKVNDKYFLRNYDGRFAILDSDFNVHKGNREQIIFGVPYNQEMGMYETKYDWNWDGIDYTVSNGYATYKFNIDTYELTILYVRDLTVKL